MGPGLAVWFERLLAEPGFYAATARRYQQLRQDALSDHHIRDAFAQLAAAPALRVRVC
jgi:hypothetical protein